MTLASCVQPAVMKCQQTVTGRQRDRSTSAAASDTPAGSRIRSAWWSRRTTRSRENRCSLRQSEEQSSHVLCVLHSSLAMKSVPHASRTAAEPPAAAAAAAVAAVPMPSAGAVSPAAVARSPAPVGAVPAAG